MKRLSLFALFLALGSPLAAATLEVPSTGTKIELTKELLERLPRTTVDAPATEHGPAAKFSGVALRALLDEAKVPSGKAVRGEYVGWVVIAEASDGYRAAFALAELDASFTDRVVILADHRGDALLDEKEGPLRIVAPDEKRPGRWERSVVRLVVGPAQVPPAAAK